MLSKELRLKSVLKEKFSNRRILLLNKWNKYYYCFDFFTLEGLHAESAKKCADYIEHNDVIITHLPTKLTNEIIVISNYNTGRDKIIKELCSKFNIK